MFLCGVRWLDSALWRPGLTGRKDKAASSRRTPNWNHRLNKGLTICAACLVAAGLVSLTGCRPAEQLPPVSAVVDPAAFDGSRALEEARRIVGLGPRDANTPGAANAARYLLARLKAQGVTNASIDEFSDYCPDGDCVFRNVIGRIPGQGRGLIMVASHYDTKSGIAGFEGANDSASSSAVLVEMAGALARTPLSPEIWLVFFDGEECKVGYGPRDGFHGSRHLADQMIVQNRIRDIRAFILLDMIGDRDLTVTFPRNSTPWLISKFFTAAAEEGAREKFALSALDIGDDHDVFFRLGVPAVDVIDFQYGSAPGRHDYWHTPEDTMDKISAESLQTIGRVTLRVLNRLSAEEALTTGAVLQAR